MVRYVMGAAGVVAGTLLVVFRRRFAALQVQSQNMLWGFRMGSRAEAMSRSAALIVGAGLIIWGGLLLAGVGRVRG